MTGDFHAGQGCKVHFAVTVKHNMPDTVALPLTWTDRACSWMSIASELVAIYVPVCGNLDGCGRAVAKDIA
jgi:hypothetical protein